MKLLGAIIETFCPNCQNVREQELHPMEKLHCLKCGYFPLQVLAKNESNSLTMSNIERFNQEQLEKLAKKFVTEAIMGDGTGKE